MATKRARLGELLLARGVCTRDELREAWEQKILFGDRLGTNLLALGTIDEHALASALGQQLGVHSGYGAVIAPQKNAIRLIPKQVAVRRYVVPHHVVDKQLYLLMRDPLDATAIDDVAFSTGLRITPVVVAEARIWQLIEIHYRTVMSLRPVPLDGVMRVHLGVLEDATATPELTSEEEFERLYAGVHGRPAELDHDIAPPPITPLEESAPPVSDEVTVPSRPLHAHPVSNPIGEPHAFLAPPRQADADDWGDDVDHTLPMVARPELLRGDQPSIVDLVDVHDGETTDTTMAPPRVREPTLDFHVEVQDVVDETPLSFADASKVLLAATDRNAIARTVLRAARTRFERACLLTVYPDRFVGWMGLGDGMSSERMRDVVVPRVGKSVFALVADSRSHYLGPLGRLPAHGGWVKATGRKIPKSIAVFPILVRRRAVNLLVVDNGHDQHVGSDVGEVLILAQQIAKTYETLLTSE